MVNAQTYPPYYSNYSPYYQQPQPVIQQPQPMLQKQILDWVGSEEEGASYPLSPGQSIYLMNRNDDYLYAKSVDQLGKTTFIKKKLVDETENKEPKIDLSEYVRKSDVETYISGIVQREVEKKVSEVSFKATKTTRRKPSAPEGFN